MKSLVIFISALIAAIVLGIFIKHDPGLVLIKYSGTSVQLPFSVFVIMFIVGVFILFISFLLIKGLIRIPADLTHWREQRRYRCSEKYMSRALLAMIEGNWGVAENSFRKCAGYSHLPMINYLGAARAAQMQGEIQRRDHYLRLAHEYNTQSSFAVSLTQAELQLDQRQTEQAYAILKHLDAAEPGSDQVKLTMIEASMQLKDWRQALELLEKVERKKKMPAEQIQSRRLRAYAGMLLQAGQAKNRVKLDEEWNKIPKNLRNEFYLLEIYIGERLHLPATGDCEPLLRRALRRKWDQELVRLYGLIKGNDPAKQLAFAEGLLAKHARDPYLLLTLGRLSKANQLWGKAITYLQESIATHANAEAYQELAGLHEQQGEHAAAAVCYQEGLALLSRLTGGRSGNYIEAVTNGGKSG